MSQMPSNGNPPGNIYFNILYNTVHCTLYTCTIFRKCMSKKYNTYNCSKLLNFVWSFHDAEMLEEACFLQDFEFSYIHFKYFLLLDSTRQDFYLQLFRKFPYLLHCKVLFTVRKVLEDFAVYD